MSKFLNRKYENLEVYTPGEQPQDMQYIKLNTNESPYPPSPGVIKAINRPEIENLRLYPDPECNVIKEKLAKLYDVKKENVYLSNGSDDILNFAFIAFTSGETTAIFPEITYGFYQVFADLNSAPYKKIPLKEDFSINYKDYCNAEGMVVIANPNAPTGISLSIDEITEILETNRDNIVLIDEAYVDFGGESCIPLIKKYDNLLVVQTFSKSRSMAGARLGFAIANEDIIKDLERIKYSTNPYNINRLTMKAAEAAIDENDYYMQKCSEIISTREKTAFELKTLGFTVLPSLSNFLFVKSNEIDGETFYKELKSRGILIRHFTTETIKDFNRVTIGTKEQMEAFIKEVKEILKERGK